MVRRSQCDEPQGEEKPQKYTDQKAHTNHPTISNRMQSSVLIIIILRYKQNTEYPLFENTPVLPGVLILPECAFFAMPVGLLQPRPIQSYIHYHVSRTEGQYTRWMFQVFAVTVSALTQ